MCGQNLQQSASLRSDQRINGSLGDVEVDLSLSTP